jgi:para-aminobenzoate synthetase component 1
MAEAVGRYSLVAVDPFLSLTARGAVCLLRRDAVTQQQFGNPWTLLEELMARYELLDEVDLPFPLGACIGFWGYDLNRFLEPQLPRRARRDLELPDLDVGFYDSLVIFDHQLEKTWIISTGLELDGSRSAPRAACQAELWRRRLETIPPDTESRANTDAARSIERVDSNLSRAEFLRAVEAAQRYIRAGDIYQVNLAQRFEAPLKPGGSWPFYLRLTALSPTDFGAYLEGGSYQLASASPELFLRISGSRVVTRPIKGTRPRGVDSISDTQLAYELQTSPKELSELVMITDLLRNDLGKVCDFGSVHVPELARLERYAHVQHLVSTVEGRLRDGLSHLSALQAAFPGGSITGAPKLRAMEIIDELEPVTRGPYTGTLGYLGFNRESQFSILIRTAVCQASRAYFHAGAGIVADSCPVAEYHETLAKAAGFFQAFAAPVCHARSALTAAHAPGKIDPA